MRSTRRYKILTFFFAVSGVSVLLLYFIINSREEYRLKARAYLNSDIQVIKQNKELGDIYKIKTLRFPGDSIDIYYWRGNRIVKSRMQAVNKMAERHVGSLLSHDEELQKSATVIIVDTDSISCIRVAAPDTNIVITYVYYLESKTGFVDAVHIYGRDYSLEDSYKVALMLLCGREVEYNVAITVKL